MKADTITGIKFVRDIPGYYPDYVSIRMASCELVVGQISSHKIPSSISIGFNGISFKKRYRMSLNFTDPITGSQVGKWCSTQQEAEEAALRMLNIIFQND